MSKYDDYEDDIEEGDDHDDYEDYMDDDEAEETPRRPEMNPFSSVPRPTAPSSGTPSGGNRFGDASRLPGSPGAPRSPIGSGSGAPPRAPAGGPGSGPGSPFSRPASPAGGAGSPPNRPAAPGAPPRNPGAFNQAPPGSPPARPTNPPGPRRDEGQRGTAPNRPGPYGRPDRPEDKREDAGGSSPFPGLGSKINPFGKPDDKDDKKDSEPASGAGSRTGLFGRSGDKPADKKDDRSQGAGGRFGMPRLGGKDDKAAANKESGSRGPGSLANRFGGGKDENKDDRGEPGGAFGALKGRLGLGGKSEDAQDRPATPKAASTPGDRSGGFLRGFGRGGEDKPADTGPARPAGPGAAPAGPRFGASGMASPANVKAATPKAPRPSIGERLKSFSLFKKPEERQTRARANKTPRVNNEGVSLDTKLDILGIALVLSALILLVNSASANQGLITGGINSFLAQTFGWGAVAVPVAMAAAGVWLILRHFGEDAPILDLVRVIGVLMLYVGLLVLFQYADSFSYELVPGTPPLDQLKNQILPLSYMMGRGGGWIGAEIYYFLVSNLTEIGGFFMLLAWLLIGVMLTLSLSAAELAIIVISIWRSLQDARRRRVQRRAAALAERQAALPFGGQHAEQLPGGRAPALPAPLAGPDATRAERSIPIHAGGRTVTASFRTGEPVVADPAPAPAQRPSPLPFRSRGASVEPEKAQEQDERTGGLGARIGGFASRMRDALPAGSAKPAETAETPAGKTVPDAEHTVVLPSDDKPASPLGRFSNVVSRAREAMPGGPGLKAQEAEESQPARQPATAHKEAQTPVQSPTPVPSASAPGSEAAAPRGSTPLPAARPGAEGDEPPVSFGSLLSAQERKPDVSRPVAPRPIPPRPEPSIAPESAKSTALPRANAPAEREEKAVGGTTEVRHQEDEKAEENGVRSRRDAEKPTAPVLEPRTFRPSVPPPAAPTPVDEAEEEGAEEDLEKLPPARPKGIGPLPRPQVSSPFNRAVPPPRTSGAVPPVQKPAMPTWQERMAALRARPQEQEEEPRPAAEKPMAREVPQPQRPAAPATKPEAEKDKEAPPEPAKAATSAPEEPAETRPASTPPWMHAPAENEAESAPTRKEAPPAVKSEDKPEDMPPLTQPTKTGIRPSGLTSPAAAYRMPETPKPPAPPARSAVFGAPDTPPATAAAPRGDSPTPPLPQGAARARKEWKQPDTKELLAAGSDERLNHDELIGRARIIEETLASFGAPGRVVEVRTGPVITQFGVEPDYLPGRNGKKIRVKVSAIAQLDKDLQLALGAKSIRIEAPVPGKGYVGVEVPNDKPSMVRLRDVLESQEFRKINSPLAIALGQGVDGTPVAADLGSMPHLLIAGTTGSGKSVCVNTIIASLLIRNTPDKLKFIMVDPKRVELTGYNGVPHLVAPVVVELERIVGVLKWVTREMDERYKKFASVGARNIVDFNKHLPEGEPFMPYIVVIIDELADLMMLAPDETERVITRIAALARATGIHLVIATQRPSVDVVTGLIKANFPARIAFAVAGGVDSRVILDQPGAERLLGRGDMLYMSGDAPAPLRLQGVFVSDSEISNITNYWRRQAGPDDTPGRPSLSTFTSGDDTPASAAWSNANRNGAQRPSSEQIAFWDRELSDEANNLDDDDPGDGEDALYEEAVDMVRRLNKASVSLLQRRLRIGYTRAARLIDMMEERGVVGPPTEGSKPRDVLPVTE